jgi:hypothetical protein
MTRGTRTGRPRAGARIRLVRVDAYIRLVAAEHFVWLKRRRTGIGRKERP